MLIAVSKEGSPLNLAEKVQNIIELKKLRKTTEYFCPVCKNPVVMKLGVKNIWHFAHASNSECIDYWEPETQYHLSGKDQLYHWLKMQYNDVEMEYYLTRPQKRPDLLLPSQNLAIEYQCSSIEESHLKSRTSSYYTHGYDVWWILGKERMRSKYKYIHSISSMEWTASRIIDHSPIIYYYCPHNKLFHLVSPQLTLTPTKTICTTLTFTPDNTSLQSFLTLPKTEITSTTLNSIFYKQKRIWRTNPHGEKSYAYYYLRKILYSKGYSLRMFPSEAGIPSQANYWLETPPYLWQTWVLIVFLSQVPLHTTFTMDQLSKAFKKLIESGILISRLNSYENGVDLALQGYLSKLLQMGVLKERDYNRYEKQYQPKMNYTMDVAIERDENILAQFV